MDSEGKYLLDLSFRHIVTEGGRCGARGYGGWSGMWGVCTVRGTGVEDGHGPGAGDPTRISRVGTDAGYEVPEGRTTGHCGSGLSPSHPVLRGVVLGGEPSVPSRRGCDGTVGVVSASTLRWESCPLGKRAVPRTRFGVLSFRTVSPNRNYNRSFLSLVNIVFKVIFVVVLTG